MKNERDTEKSKKLKELELKLEERKKKEIEKNQNYQPPLISENEKKDYNLTQDFVDAQNYFSKNYKTIKEQYSDDTWLIVGKNGICESSQDYQSIRKSFYKNKYVGKALLTKIGRKMEHKFAKTIHIEDLPIKIPMVF